MKSNNSNTDTKTLALHWFNNVISYQEAIDLRNKYFPIMPVGQGISEYDVLTIYLSEHPQTKESNHITWWEGLTEEEQTKLCQKHFQGIPIDSLMERSIKVMYHYENPLTTEKEVSYTAPDYLGLATENESLKQQLSSLQAENEALKQENAAKLGYNNYLEADNERLREALNKILNIENASFGLKAFDSARLKSEIKEALQNK